MQKTLYVLRHAKSDWDDPDLDDHDRPLAPRGRQAAPLIAGWLRDRGHAPALVLCSSALRTRQTLEHVAEAVPDAEVRVEDELYLASAGELLGRLRAVAEPIPSVLLIGHNPGLQALVLALAGRSPARRQVEGKFPTAALAVLAAPGSWADLDEGAAELVEFVRPRDLAGQ